MNPPNVNILWGRVIVDELIDQGIDSFCLAPGSRSTPLVMALAENDGIEMFSHLDERSAAFFALGRAKRTGRPTPVISTSGTAAANFHPAVIEANVGRVPMLILTADRPPELRDSGANQTIDQTHLYGDEPRWYRTLPEPEAAPRKLRMLRTTIARAFGRSLATPPGPVHINIPFRKPLAPIEDQSIREGFETNHSRAVSGRSGPYVRTTMGRPTLDEADVTSIAQAIRSAENGLLVVGPKGVQFDGQWVCELASATGFPVFADPLSGVRFGSRNDTALVCGGYDGYLNPAVTADWPHPDIVLHFGAAPTSKALQSYLESVDARKYLFDPASGWQDPSFTAGDHVEVDPTWVARQMHQRIDSDPSILTDRVRRIETDYWDFLESERLPPEAQIVDDILNNVSRTTSIFVSNSMPVRDIDRFGRPQDKPISVYGNRGASGIDGIISTALGIGSADKDDLILITGDLAFYHDMNGLLALDRCGVETTIVLINNDGGGIFHMLPIENFDPPFTKFFKTPHGLDFRPTGDLYEFNYERISQSSFADVLSSSVDDEGSKVIEVKVDAERNHRMREELNSHVIEFLS